MFRDFKLTLPTDAAERVAEAYSGDSTIIEYGTGGSTIFAAKQPGATIIAVESDVKWLMELVARSSELKLPGRVMPMYVDIGVTRQWGYPVDDTRKMYWPQYALKPWWLAREQKLKVDTVLIDGRFRVACMVASLYHGKPGCRILFDDYLERPRYHDVEQLCTLKRLIGRMAEFEVPEKRPSDKALRRFLKYFHDPR